MTWREQSQTWPRYAATLTQNGGVEVAACGGHSLALTGVPGNGKTVLARALLGLLPALVPRELENIRQWSSEVGVALPVSVRNGQRPMLQGLDAMAWIAMALQGHEGRLGAIQHGTLLLVRLDCFAYSPWQIQRLGLVLDQGRDVQLVLTQQPCPCGFYGDPLRECTCMAPLITRQQRRMRSLMERVPVALEIPRPDYEHQMDSRSPETLATTSARVQEGAERQRARFAGLGITRNAGMDHAQILRFCGLEASAQKLLRAAYQGLHFSVRIADGVLAVARTIADLAHCESIQANHLAEAVQYTPHLNAL